MRESGVGGVFGEYLGDECVGDDVSWALYNNNDDADVGQYEDDVAAVAIGDFGEYFGDVGRYDGDVMERVGDCDGDDSTSDSFIQVIVLVEDDEESSRSGRSGVGIGDTSNIYGKPGLRSSSNEIK